MTSPIALYVFVTAMILYAVTIAYLEMKVRYEYQHQLALLKSRALAETVTDKPTKGTRDD